MKQKKSIAILTALPLLCGMTALPVSAEDTDTIHWVPLNRNGKVFSDNQGTAYASCNDKYYDAWAGGEGSYLAYDLSDYADDSALGTVELVWYSGAWGNYDYTVLPESPYASMSGYTIAVNDAPGGDYPADGWKGIVTVTGCTAHSAEHVFDVTGYRWVRLTVDALQTGTQVSLNVDIHAPQIVYGENLIDSWMFYGDSITACGMTTFGTGNGNFADLLHAIDHTVYPAQQNGGIGGIRSTEGKANIDRWLANFDGQYVSIAYGTNDCWGNQTGAQGYYENTVYMIKAAQNAGKTVVLPKIPYSLEPGVASYVEDYNAMIDRIYAENRAVIPGPDFYAFFKEHPDLLSGDGVHPSDEGYGAMRQLWAEDMYEKIYKIRGKSAMQVIYPGDVNMDGEVSLADAVLLAQYLICETDSLPQWRAADMNGDGKLNAVDLSLLKHEFLMTEDEKIDRWLTEQPEFTILLDYSEWAETLVSYGVTGAGVEISDNSLMHTLVIKVPKLDPRTDTGTGRFTVLVSLAGTEMQQNSAVITCYQYVRGIDGTAANLYNSVSAKMERSGQLTIGESK